MPESIEHFGCDVCGDEIIGGDEIQCDKCGNTICIDCAVPQEESVKIGDLIYWCSDCDEDG